MLNKLSRFFDPRKSARPYHLFQIESALDCTLECVMCPWGELRTREAVMAWDTFEKIIPYLPLTESVDLTGGGEPLRQPRLADMVAAAKAAGCQVGFSTNGSGLLPPLTETLLDLGLDWISFSVDAASPELYERIRRGANFENVYRNISNLRNRKIERQSAAPRILMVYVMMTGAEENYHELPAFIDLAHNLGVEQVIAKNLDVILKDGDDQRRLFSHQGQALPAVESAIAAAGQRAAELGIALRLYAMRPQEVTICEHNPLGSIFFNWQGEISPCITLSYAEKRVFDGQRIIVPCQRFGNIRNEALESVWDKPEYRQFRQRYLDRQAAEQRLTIDRMLGGPQDDILQLPPAPEGCQTCYYLYGI